jgi:hypothetical protein
VFIASEDFLQKRARGLCRFLNFVVNHPILGNDEIVKLFLTEPKVTLKPSNLALTKIIIGFSKSIPSTNYRRG